MLRLIPFELKKIWQKRSFALSVCVLMTIHVFLLWYNSLPNEEIPPLSAYKEIQTKLSGMDENEKAGYIAELKETLDGICFVRDILAMQSLENKLGSLIAEQELKNNPGVFEAYYNFYQSGKYLEFTDSLEQEKALIDEIYEEQQRVAGYGDYLRSIQESKDILGSISIFGGQNQDSYSARNLQKSAEDYITLNDENISFTPSKTVTSSMECAWTDILLFISVLMFVAGLITEEKEKKLFFVTRGTKRGIIHSIGAKLMALLVHCTIMTVLFYTVSIVFYGQSAGWFNPGASLQSIAPYMESSLSINILGYIIFSVITKALVLSAVGAMLTALGILFSINAMPFLIGFVLAGISVLLYLFIPAGSTLSVFKYLNLVGLMKTENLYGNYLNFNFFGYPVSRLNLSLALLLIIFVIAVIASLWFFCHMQSFEVRKIRLSFPLPFKPHTSILRHEGYKLLITNRAFMILIIFIALLAWKNLDNTYIPSVGEQYYRDIMIQLEGELDETKEALVLSEQKRYEEALKKVEQIDEMLSNKELSDDVAEALKAHEYITLSFYPSFQRVEAQYQHIKEYGGSFVYDTGYLYLFGIYEDVFSVDLLILSIGIILAVSGSISMEYQNGSMLLICATKSGKRKIITRKIFICILMAAVLTILPIVCRAFQIASVYTMNSFSAAIQNIPHFADFKLPLPIFVFVLLFVISQIVAVVLITLITLALSIWRKNQVQTIFFALLALAVPMILKLLGFDIAKWFSLYPLYAWTGGV